MADPRETPPADLSLKYMAWSLKELSKNVEKMVTAMDNYFTYLREEAVKKANPVKKFDKYEQEEIPF